MTISAILFDADGVIQQTAPEFMRRISRFLGKSSGQAERFLEEIFAAERPCLTGQHDFAEQLADVLARWRLAAPPEALMTAWEAIDPVPGIEEVIGGLRQRGYECCLATNQQAYRTRYMRSALRYDRLFDQQFYSCELGVKKPEREFFLEIVASLGRDPGDLLFIDDNEGNVEAARSCAINGLRFDQREHAEPASALAAALVQIGIEI